MPVEILFVDGTRRRGILKGNFRTTTHAYFAFPSLKAKFHLACHAMTVSTRHDAFDLSSPCILAVSNLSNSTARHARLDALDT